MIDDVRWRQSSKVGENNWATWILHKRREQEQSRIRAAAQKSPFVVTARAVRASIAQRAKKWWMKFLAH
jgi:hypothetical protein